MATTFPAAHTRVGSRVGFQDMAAVGGGGAAGRSSTSTAGLPEESARATKPQGTPEEFLIGTPELGDPTQQDVWKGGWREASRGQAPDIWANDTMPLIPVHRSTGSSANLPASRRDLEALEDLCSRQLSHIKVHSERIMEVVVQPLESKVSSLEAKQPALEWQLTDLGGAFRALGEQVQQQRRASDGVETAIIRWRKQLEKEAQVSQKELQARCDELRRTHEELRQESLKSWEALQQEQRTLGATLAAHMQAFQAARMEEREIVMPSGEWVTQQELAEEAGSLRQEMRLLVDGAGVDKHCITRQELNSTIELVKQEIRLEWRHFSDKAPRGDQAAGDMQRELDGLREELASLKSRESLSHSAGRSEVEPALHRAAERAERSAEQAAERAAEKATAAAVENLAEEFRIRSNAIRDEANLEVQRIVSKLEAKLEADFDRWCGQAESLIHSSRAQSENAVPEVATRSLEDQRSLVEESTQQTVQQEVKKVTAKVSTMMLSAFEAMKDVTQKVDDLSSDFGDLRNYSSELNQRVEGIERELLELRREIISVADPVRIYGMVQQAMHAESMAYEEVIQQDHKMLMELQQKAAVLENRLTSSEKQDAPNPEQSMLMELQQQVNLGPPRPAGVSGLGRDPPLATQAQAPPSAFRSQGLGAISTAHEVKLAGKREIVVESPKASAHTSAEEHPPASREGFMGRALHEVESLLPWSHSTKKAPEEPGTEPLADAPLQHSAELQVEKALDAPLLQSAELHADKNFDAPVLRAAEVCIDQTQTKLAERKVLLEENVEHEASEEDEDHEDEDEEAHEAEVERARAIMERKGMGMRNQVIFAERWTAQEGWKPPVYPKSPDQAERIKKALHKSFMFAALPPESLAQVIDAFNGPHMLEPGTEVIKQGASISSAEPAFYILEDGQLEVFKRTSPDDAYPGKHVFTYTQMGESFGELALLYPAPRAATVISSTPAVVWSIDRDSFNHLVKESYSTINKRRAEFLESVDLLRNLNADDRAKLVDVIKSKAYGKGDYIVRQGEEGDHFYIVETGSAAAYVDGMHVKEYGPGGYFGELALISRSTRAADVIATGDANVLYLDADTFRRLLGDLKDFEARVKEEYSAATDAARAAAPSHTDKGEASRELEAPDEHKEGILMRAKHGLAHMMHLGHSEEAPHDTATPEHHTSSSASSKPADEPHHGEGIFGRAKHGLAHMLHLDGTAHHEPEQTAKEPEKNPDEALPEQHPQVSQADLIREALGDPHEALPEQHPQASQADLIREATRSSSLQLEATEELLGRVHASLHEASVGGKLDALLTEAGSTSHCRDLSAGSAQDVQVAGQGSLDAAIAEAEEVLAEIGPENGEDAQLVLEQAQKDHAAALTLAHKAEEEAAQLTAMSAEVESQHLRKVTLSPSESGVAERGISQETSSHSAAVEASVGAAICSNCSHTLEAGDLFCFRCGTKRAVPEVVSMPGESGGWDQLADVVSPRRMLGGVGEGLTAESVEVVTKHEDVDLSNVVRSVSIGESREESVDDRVQGRESSMSMASQVSLFTRIDINRDGVIDREEMERALRTGVIYQPANPKRAATPTSYSPCPSPSPHTADEELKSDEGDENFNSCSDEEPGHARPSWGVSSILRPFRRRTP